MTPSFGCHRCRLTRASVMHVGSRSVLFIAIGSLAGMCLRLHGRSAVCIRDRRSCLEMSSLIWRVGSDPLPHALIVLCLYVLTFLPSSPTVVDATYNLSLRWSVNARSSVHSRTYLLVDVVQAKQLRNKTDTRSRSHSFENQTCRP